jgi:hypothetical protein
MPTTKGWYVSRLPTRSAGYRTDQLTGKPMKAVSARSTDQPDLNRTDYLYFRTARKRGVPMQLAHWQVYLLSPSLSDEPLVLVDVGVVTANRRRQRSFQPDSPIWNDDSLMIGERMGKPSQSKRWSRLYDDITVTLKQTWQREEPIAAMCVQYVDVQCVCNSH